MCDRWLESFEAFLEDMGARPSKGMTLDRIDGDGNYEPSNCRWATRKEQSNNMCRNRFINFRGKRMTIAQWEAETGISGNCITLRLRCGWTVQRALTEPPQRITLGQSDMNAIRGEYESGKATYRSLARKYGVSASTIGAIVRGKTTASTNY